MLGRQEAVSRIKDSAARKLSRSGIEYRNSDFDGSADAIEQFRLAIPTGPVRTTSARRPRRSCS